MRKYDRKPHRYKKRKPIFRKKFLTLGFLVLIAAGAVFYGLFLWKIFWVEKIIINGEEKITKEEIEFLVSKRLENTVLFFETKSILAVDGGEIKNDILNAFPRISEVKVSKNLFDAISVQITERTAVALWCENENCFSLDDRGVIFEEASLDSGLIIIETDQSPNELVLGETVMPADKIVQILAIRSKLIETLQISIITAKVFDERLDVKTAEGWTIRFNLKGDLDWQVTELKLALEKQISPEKRKSLEYIDLRFSRVYYK
jgi:cell division septal protein FtsQ